MRQKRRIEVSILRFWHVCRVPMACEMTTGFNRCAVITPWTAYPSETTYLVRLLHPRFFSTGGKNYSGTAIMHGQNPCAVITPSTTYSSASNNMRRLLHPGAVSTRDKNHSGAAINARINIVLCWQFPHALPNTCFVKSKNKQFHAPNASVLLLLVAEACYF